MGVSRSWSSCAVYVVVYSVTIKVLGRKTHTTTIIGCVAAAIWGYCVVQAYDLRLRYSDYYENDGWSSSAACFGHFKDMKELCWACGWDRPCAGWPYSVIVGLLLTCLLKREIASYPLLSFDRWLYRTQQHLKRRAELSQHYISGLQVGLL